MEKKMNGAKRRVLSLALALAMIVCSLPLYSNGMVAEAAETSTWDSWEELYDAMVAKEEEDGFNHRSAALSSMISAGNSDGIDVWAYLVEVMDSLDIADAETDYDKVYAIANWIGANISYGDGSTAYDGLINGNTACGGYSSLFCIMCEYVGVNAIEVSCSETNHAWNAVEVDGSWYWADITNFTSVEKNMGRFLYGNDSGIVLEYWSASENAVAAGSAVNSLISDYSYYYYNSSCNGEHDWVITGYSNAGTNYVCENGGTAYECSKCGCVHCEVFDSDVAHTWETVTVDPTCTSEGYSYEICSVCGIYHLLDGSFYDYKFDITEALGHDETGTDDLIITKEPTCTASGIGYTYCTRCGQRITRVTIAAAGHTWDEGTVTTEATATTAGVKTYACETCGTTKTEAIAATGGSLEDAVITLEYDSCVYDGEYHYPEVTVEVDGVEVENTVTATTESGSTIVYTGTMYTVAYKTGSSYYKIGEIPITVSAGTNGLLADEVTVYFTIEQAGTTITATIDSDTIEAGDTAQITASAVTDTGVSRTCKYASSDISVATVSSSGLVTAKSSGVAVITITTSDSSYYEVGYAYITVTVTEADKTDISGATVTLDTDTYTYDGTAKEPEVTVTYEGTALTSGTDYMVSYADNTAAGTATVTVAGCGDYTGSVTKTFTIAQADISGAAVTLGTSSYTYDGTAKTPSVTVTMDGNTLASGTDYTVSYSGNTEAGTAVVTITGCGNYTGTASETYTIEPADISGAAVELSSNEYTYTGSAKKPSVSVTMNGAALTSGTDYTVSYSDNINAGTATVTVTGAGNYTGTATAKFAIVKADPVLTASDVSVSCGSTASVGASVTSGGTLSYESSDTSVATADSSGVVTGVKPGTAEITVTAAATDNYNAAFTTVTATVSAVDISGAAVTPDTTSYTYDGISKTPFVTVVLDGVTLVSGTDYLVTYSNNINAGTAAITVTGIGSYTGTATATFKITKAPQVITLSADSTTLTAGGTLALTASVSTGNTITYTSSDTSVATVNSSGMVTGVSAGTVTITASVAGTDNYSTASASVTLTVKAASEAVDISGAEVALGTNTYTYDGTEKTPSVTVTLDGTALTSGTDYTVAYTNNVNAGTAIVTVTGCGNYTGTVTATFTIVKASQVVTLSASSTTLAIGSTLALTGSVSTGNTITYTSSDTSVATVSSSGVVTGVSVGTVTITASVEGTDSYSASSASVTLTVTPAAVTVTAISNTSTGVNLTWGQAAGANGYYIYRKTSSTDYVLIGTVTSGSTVTYTDTTAVAGTSYTYKVIPYSGSVTGDSAGGKGIIRLVAPTISSATNVSSGITVAWNRASGANGYYVYRKTSSTSYTLVGTVTSGTTLSYTDTSAVAGTSYTYCVKAYYKNSAGAVTTSAASGGKGIIRLAAPTISSATNVTSGITVSWSRVSGANGYYVYRKTSSTSYTLIATITSGSTLSYTDTAVKSKSGTTYTYCVKGYYKNSGGVVTPGVTSGGKGIMRLSSAAISSLTNTSSGITVKWGKITGANGYYVYRKVSGGSYSLVKTITSGSTVSYSDTAVKSKNGTTYVYYVIPYFKNSSGAVTKGSYSNTKTIARLTAVSISSLTNSSSKKMTVKWGKNSSATGYEIQYSTSSSFASGNKTVTVTSASTVSKVISSLTKGKTYYVRVRAYKTVSGTKYYSAWSSKKSVKISK